MMMTRRTIAAVLAAATLSSVGVAAYWWTRDPSAESLLRAPLPASARVIATADRAGFFGGSYFAVIELSEGDFRALAAAIGVAHRPDLLSYWSSALRGPTDMPSWDVRNINDANTLFGDARQSTYLVARYENGRMYLKVHVH